MIRELTATAIIFILQTGSPFPPRSGEISGQILHPNGSPVANVMVTAVTAHEPSQVSSITQTDDAGRYRLPRVPAGDYIVRAGPLKSPVYFPGVARREDAMIIAVGGEKDLGPVSFQVGLTVSGRVVHQGGTAPGAFEGLVRLENAKTIFVAGERSGGTFEFGYLKPDTYKLLFGRHRLGDIKVTDQNISGLEFVIPGNVNGRFVVEGNGAMPKTATFSYRKGECSAGGDACFFTTSVSVRPDGSFQVAIPDGLGVVDLVSGVPENSVLKSFKYGSYDLLRDRRARPYSRPNAEMLLTLSPR